MFGPAVDVRRAHYHPGVVDGKSRARLARWKRPQVGDAGRGDPKDPEARKRMARSRRRIRRSDGQASIIYAIDAAIASPQPGECANMVATKHEALGGRKAVHQIAAAVHPACNIALAIDPMGDRIWEARHSIDNGGSAVLPDRGVDRARGLAPIRHRAIEIQGDRNVIGNRRQQAKIVNCVSRCPRRDFIR